MIEFIKKLFKSKNNEEFNKVYKKVPEPNEIEPKANYIVNDEYVVKSFKANKIIANLFDSYFGGIRPDQEECPIMVIYNFKKLLELGDDEALIRAIDLLQMYLSESQEQDFINKVCQLKEYKEWRMNKRIKELEEDFK